jgi:hypothetical protein
MIKNKKSTRAQKTGVMAVAKVKNLQLSGPVFFPDFN